MGNKHKGKEASESPLPIQADSPVGKRAGLALLLPPPRLTLASGGWTWARRCSTNGRWGDPGFYPSLFATELPPALSESLPQASSSSHPERASPAQTAHVSVRHRTKEPMSCRMGASSHSPGGSGVVQLTVGSPEGKGPPRPSGGAPEVRALLDGI